jgi:L-methionine (R)-S-oxide reductase
MAEEIIIDKSLSKEEKYKELIPQIKSLTEGESELTTNLAQICAALKYSMDRFFWVGFYLRKGDELVLGPFQGPVACSRIKIPNGVCGLAADKRATILVPDVNQFPGHIACSTQSKSEIVTPIFKNEEVVGVLDVDSDTYNNFDGLDKIYLEQLAALVSQLIK